MGSKKETGQKGRIIFQPTEENSKKLKIMKEILGVSISDTINLCLSSLDIPSETSVAFSDLEKIREDFRKEQKQTVERLLNKV